jgi:mono/diheme cytochrome c family protein
MRGKVIPVAALLVVALIVVAAFAQARQPAIPALADPATQRGDPALIEHGAQLAAVGDCMVCHTAQGGQPFAGGRPLDTPFGTLYTTNITPDPATGIGLWSLDAFSRAMRKGVSRDGHLLYPAFPYPHFTHMSDGDIAAVYAYMMSRTPVSATPPSNRLTFPLNFRPLVAGWNLLFLHEGQVADDTSESADWNRGRYLVNGLGHCAACHTPMNALGAERGGQQFAGGLVEGWEAPPLTKLLQAPTPWTLDQLVSYLSVGLATQHSAAAGPMLPVARSLADASQADVKAMATYLMSLQVPAASSPPSPAAASSTGVAESPMLKNGELLFRAACASCHGAGSPMSTLAERPSLSQSTAVNADSPRNTVRVMLDGIGWQGNGPAHYMPSFATMFSDAQIADIANYTRAQYSTRAPWPSLDESAVAKLRKETSQP